MFIANENRSNNKIDSKKYSTNKYFIFKRFFDILLSVVALPVILVIIFIAGCFIKIDTKGPVFFTQTRAGLAGKPFTIIKLRSMIVDAEKNTGSIWAVKNDARITKVGKVLRKFRIDELPQFINVIVGDMSIIGPRPEKIDLTEEFDNLYPGFKNRLLVKPGITGLAQINGGYDIMPSEKMKFDLEYIENVSLLLDIKIIIGTVSVILTGEGSR